MLIFKDIFTNDELFSDACKPILDADGLLYRFPAKMKEEQTKIDDSLIGGNASAEEVQEESECAASKGFDFVLNHRLKEQNFSKKDFKGYLKTYFAKLSKHISEKHPDKLDAFKNAAKTASMRWLEEFDNLSFYSGETDDIGEHTLCVLKWNDDGMSGEVSVIAHGLDQEKY